MTNALLAEQDDTLFTAKSNGDLIRARPLAGIDDPATVALLWDRLSRFPILFASAHETNFSTFKEILESADTLLIAFYKEGSSREPLGIGMIYEIAPGVEAKIQVSFFDQRLKGRESIIRNLVSWTFDTLMVRRVATHIRADARSMRSFFEKVGFYFEGVLKNWVQRGTRYYDLYLYGICEHECDDHWKVGRSWAKPRVKLLEVYETR